MAHLTTSTQPPSALMSAGKAVTRYPMVWALALLIFFTGLLYPNFWSTSNLNNMLQQNVPLALIAIGMTYVIIAQGFDLSVGAIFAGGAVVYATFSSSMPIALGLAITLSFGVLAGLMNGILVARLRINAFVATLGTASIIYGAVSLLAGSGALRIENPGYSFFRQQWFGLSVAVYIAIAVFVAAGLLLSRSTFGRSVYAVGGNYEAARLAGVRVRLTIALTFVMIGGLASLAGAILASQVGVAQPNYGASMPLDAIAAVVIGGTALTGGEGAIWRTAVGVMILAVINNLFSALTLDPALQNIIKGAIVVIAVGFDRWSMVRRSS